jgi:4-amino-4-deoxy-L-arabinose transferase-like glycosyltransferase
MSTMRELVGRSWVQHLLVVVLGAALLLPNMGMGLYDPWETHYAEVARRIHADGDWITTRWHSDSRLGDDVNRRCRADPHECHFFSKPVLIFWLMALSFEVAYIDEAEQEQLLEGLEGDERAAEVAAILNTNDAAARFPITLVGLAGLFGVYWYIRRMLGLRTGLFAAAVLATTPYYYLLSRQIMTDIAFVVPLSVGLLALTYWFTYPDEARPRHLYLFYALAGLATLAKGLMGFMLPGAIMLVFMLLTPSTFVERLKRLRIERGALVFLSVAGPWYGAVYAINGRPWFMEFIVKHHFRRVGEGVHGERGSFEYFIEQLGYGLWPWVALLPLAAGLVWFLGSSERLRRARGLWSLLVIWAVFGFALFTISTTKFHHYIFPAVPPMAILIGIALSRLWEAKPTALEKVSLLAGAGLLAAVTPILLDRPYQFINLFIYKYDRHYPELESASTWMGVGVGIFALGLLLLLLPKLAKVAAVVLCAGAITITGWNIHGMMTGYEDNLSLRDAFEAYYTLRQPGDRLREWALRWRGEVWYSRDTGGEINQESLSAMRRALGQPGRVFVGTTSPDALDRRTRRLFGRGVKTVNAHPIRYAMTLWDGPPEGTAEKALVAQVPQRATELNARLGEDIELLAYELSPERVRRGGVITLVLYWRATKRLREEWTVFIHGDHPSGNRNNRMINDHSPADGFWPTTNWRVGQIVRDEIQVEARDDQPLATYRFYAGLFDDDGRMPVTAGPSDGDDRVELGSVEVDR